MSLALIITFETLCGSHITVDLTIPKGVVNLEIRSYCVRKHGMQKKMYKFGDVILQRAVRLFFFLSSGDF